MIFRLLDGRKKFYILTTDEDRQESRMPEIRCENCGAAMMIPAGYDQPYVKCSSCGGHQKSPDPEASGPRYRILDSEQRARSQGQVLDLAALTDSEEPPADSGYSAPSVAGPALAPAAKKAAEAQKTASTYRVINKPLNEKKLLEDALGKNGFAMVLQTVAGFVGELNEKKRQAGKGRAVQALMRAKIPAELAARAVDYAEKSPEIEHILWADYKASLVRGLAIFFIGVVLSIGVHLLAHPGWEFVLFQVPFAVGFAYAVNAAINMAGLKIAALRSEAVHYAFLAIAALTIILYVIAGVWY